MEVGAQGGPVIPVKSGPILVIGDRLSGREIRFSIARSAWHRIIYAVNLLLLPI